MTPLDFLGDLIPSPVRDLLTWDKTQAPRAPGAYILLAGSGATFRYPAGESPVFYIGQAGKLRSRLWRHMTAIRQAREARRHCVYRPTREYGAAFGTHYSFVLAPSGWLPKRLEDVLMARFARRYRSLPVANGAGAWRRIRAIIDCESQAESAHAP
jgi:hypothetical protein